MSLKDGGIKTYQEDMEEGRGTEGPTGR